MLDAAHLIERHPDIERRHAAERIGFVAILQALGCGFEEFEAEIEIELLARRQIGAMNRFQRGHAVGKMFFAALESGGRAVGPAIVLAGVADVCGDLRIILHPALPIGVEERAEFLRSFRFRARGWLLRILGLAKSEQRQHEHRAADSRGKDHEYAHHASLPAAVASSLSRSRASMTMRRAVSAASIAVLSTSGETLRSRSRLSRSRTSSSTCASVISSPFS